MRLFFAVLPFMAFYLLGSLIRYNVLKCQISDYRNLTQTFDALHNTLKEFFLLL